MSTTQTNVEQTQVEDLDNLLGMPGAESVITPKDGDTIVETPKSFFDKDRVDTTVLDIDTPETSKVADTEETDDTEENDEESKDDKSSDDNEKQE